MPHGIQREVLTAAFLVAVLGIWALALLELAVFGSTRVQRSTCVGQHSLAFRETHVFFAFLKFVFRCFCAVLFFLCSSERWHIFSVRPAPSGDVCRSGRLSISAYVSGPFRHFEEYMSLLYYDAQIHELWRNTAVRGVTVINRNV